MNHWYTDIICHEQYLILGQCSFWLESLRDVQEKFFLNIINVWYICFQAAVNSDGCERLQYKCHHWQSKSAWYFVVGQQHFTMQLSEDRRTVFWYVIWWIKLQKSVNLYLEFSVAVCKCIYSFKIVIISICFMMQYPEHHCWTTKHK